ncbi:MAG: hypothetical protein ACO1OB_28730 [Archangium sp.]
MNARAWLISTVLVSACAPEPRVECDRQPVDRTGLLAPAFVDNVAELVTLDEPAVIRVFAPLTSCASDTPRATAELYDLNNVPVVLGPLTITAIATPGAVRIDVPFTPTLPGAYFLRVAAEPNLGVRSTMVVAVEQAQVDAGVVVPAPASRCSEALWPLGSDAVVCTSKDAGEVDVFFADGGSTQFPGIEVVTAGDVIWSFQPTTGAVERRVYADAGLVLALSRSGFAGGEVTGNHGDDFAVRRGSSGVVQVLFADGHVEMAESDLGLGPYLYDGVRLRSLDRVRCDVQPACIALPNWKAMDRDFVWSTDVNDVRFLRAWPLPLTPASRPVVSMARQLPGRQLRGPFALQPLWLEFTDGNAVLAGFEDGHVSLRSWPYPRVRTVGSAVVVLFEANDSVRLVHR